MAKGTIVVTGANGGLGSAIVEKLLWTAAYSEYHMIFTVRKVETAETLNAVIARHRSSLTGSGKKAPPQNFEVFPLDLGSLASTRKLADGINARVAKGEIPPIAALILNAAFSEYSTLTFSNDGFDMSFQANYLSHWLLTLKLLQSMDKDYGRIVVLGSWSHDPYDKRNDSMGVFKEEKWKTVLHDTETFAKGKYSTPEEEGGYSGFRRYGAGKLCEIMMIYELQSRLDADPALSNISILGVDPGAMPTSIMRRGNFVLAFIIGRVLLPALAPITTWLWPNGDFRTTAKSAGDVLRAAFNTAELGARPKALYLNGSLPARSSAESRDEGKRRMLWGDSVGYAGLKEGETALAEWR